MPCGFCGGPVAEVLNLGDMALAGGFLLPEDFEREKKYPLALGFCEPCSLAQVVQPVDVNLFANYSYRSGATATMRAHFKALAREIYDVYRPHSVVEIGCNDGTLARELVRLDMRVVGVDPAGVCEDDTRGLRLIDECFTEDIARRIGIGSADMVIGNNVFAHVRDIHGLTGAIAAVLKPNGIFVFEVHYLGEMLRGTQYDVIYHEHLFYYSLAALEKHFARYNMQVFRVTPLPTHAGSMRFYVCNGGTWGESMDVPQLRRQERDRQLGALAGVQQFAFDAKRHMEKLSLLLGRLWAEGRTVAGYGASGRANTMLQACGIDTLAYIVDDCEARQGWHTPGTHIPVVAADRLSSDPPDLVLVTGWSYLDEIAPKCAGLPLVVPFPEPRIERERMAA